MKSCDANLEAWSFWPLIADPFPECTVSMLNQLELKTQTGNLGTGCSFLRYHLCIRICTHKYISVFMLVELMLNGEKSESSFKHSREVFLVQIPPIS